METPKAQDTARGEATLIGKSIVIKGELSCGDDLYVDGQVEGAIDPKGNRLTIGPNGRVKANVNACSVVVQGKLDGNIQASDRVDLKQSAVVTGDIATQRISIEEGAYFKGRVNIQKEAPKKEAAPSSKSCCSAGCLKRKGARADRKSLQYRRRPTLRARSYRDEYTCDRGVANETATRYHDARPERSSRSLAGTA